MTSLFEAVTGGRVFEEFEYQIVYLRPSPALDERIAVGLLCECPGRIEARFVSSVAALNSLAQLVGNDGLEQFHFAADELRRTITRVASLQDLRMPSDMFVPGESQVAFTADRASLLISILSSSCLLRSPPVRSAEPKPVGSNLSKEIVEHVARLSPLVADRIFNRRVNVESDEVKLPIFGNRIFGASVSFAGKDHSMQAEAYIAKFRWLKMCVSREPRIYVLKPSSESAGADSEVRVKKLQAIADASEVQVRIADTAEGIAAQILQDEAA